MLARIGAGSCLRQTRPLLSVPKTGQPHLVAFAGYFALSELLILAIRRRELALRFNCMVGDSLRP
jgi:hypothetical protein